MDPKDLCKRLEVMKNDAANHREHWERMAPYVCPSRRGIIAQWTPGTPQTRQVYDSTTLMAAELMSQFMASNTIDPSQQWMSWEPDDPEIAKDDEAREWCEESRDRYLTALANSQFYSEGVEALMDYGGFGTGFLLNEEAPQPSNITKNGFRGFYFKAERTGHFYIAEGPDGIVDTGFREFESTVDAVVRQFGVENTSPKIQGLYNQKKLDEKVKMVHAAVPRPKGDNGAGSRGMPWASCWIEYDTKHMCKEGGYRTFPAAVPRYSKTPGEVFGRGRGDIAFPDTWTLNRAKAMGLEDWALKIRPPMLVSHNSVIGSIKLVPGGPTVLNTHGRPVGEVLKAYETGSHPEVSHLNEEELRKSIREVFYVEHILELMRVQKSEMTAFEFAKKLNLLFKLLGPVYGRLQRELLYVITEIGFDIMYHARAFSPPPPIMFRNGAIKTVFHNPIAKAQRSVDAETLAMVVNDLAPLAQIPSIGPAVFDRIDYDKTADGIMNNRGFPAKWSRNDREIATLRKARQDQEEAQLETAQASAYAESAGKVAPLVKVLSESKKAV